MSGNIVNVTDASFEQDVLQSDVPVLVDYWAEWCGPCKMIAPVLEEIADEYDGKLKVCKLNIDENEQTPPKFNIRGIPTLMLFKNGNVDATKSALFPSPSWRPSWTAISDCRRVIRKTAPEPRLTGGFLWYLLPVPGSRQIRVFLFHPVFSA